MTKFRVRCGEGTCTVALTERGVRFLHHTNADVWAAARSSAVLDSLSAVPVERWGCQRLAELISRHTYTAVRFPEGSQRLLATLYGLTIARKRKKAKEIST